MKNKILPILCIFILISFILIGNSFAYTITYNDNTFGLKDEWFVIAESLPEYGEYDLVIFRKELTGSDHMYIAFISAGGCLYDSLQYDGITKRELILKDCTLFKSYVYSADTFEFLHEGESFSQFTYRIDSADAIERIYSEKNIYTDSSCTKLFFQAPVPSLAMVLAKNSPVKNFQTMMLGMIPYLIAFLVGLVAFWKAWQLLLKELRKA